MSKNLVFHADLLSGVQWWLLTPPTAKKSKFGKVFAAKWTL